jgi:hypothetical protein
MNFNKKCGTEEKDGERQTSGEVVKKKKYRKYDDIYLDFGFTSIDDNHQESSQCIICRKLACFQIN